MDGRTLSVEQLAVAIEGQIAQLRLNANGIEAIEALFAQLRGFASHFRARDAADSTSSGNSGTTRPGARVCAALCL